MKTKDFTLAQLKVWLPTVIAYLLLLTLFKLLLIFYRLSQAVFADIIRFSLPLQLIWIVVDTYLAAYKICLLDHQKTIIPTTPVESDLFKARRDAQRTIQQLNLRHHEKFDRLELYSHESRIH